MSLQIHSNDGIKHCHNNSHAQKVREQERKVARKRLFVASVLCLLFMIGEVLGGYFAGSLAVMTDAAHLMVDFTSFIISLFSLWLSSRPATQRLGYGCHRAEILGALLSVFTIWLVTGVLVYLAAERLISNNYTIEGTVMLITSGCAVLANIVMALALQQSGHSHSQGGLSSHGHGHSHKKGNEHNQISNNAHSKDSHADLEQNGLNHGRRAQQANASTLAAFIHVMGDLLQSISVFISALIIFFKPEYKVVDPICTFLFSIFVLSTTLTILSDIRIVLMEDESVDAQTVLREMTLACFSSYNFHSVTIQMEQQADLKPG